MPNTWAEEMSRCCLQGCGPCCRVYSIDSRYRHSGISEHLLLGLVLLSVRLGHVNPLPSDSTVHVVRSSPPLPDPSSTIYIHIYVCVYFLSPWADLRPPAPLGRAVSVHAIRVPPWGHLWLTTVCWRDEAPTLRCSFVLISSFLFFHDHYSLLLILFYHDHFLLLFLFLSCRVQVTPEQEAGGARQDADGSGREAAERERSRCRRRALAAAAAFGVALGEGWEARRAGEEEGGARVSPVWRQRFFVQVGVRR